MKLGGQFGVAAVVDGDIDDRDAGVAERLFESVVELVHAVDADPFGAERCRVLGDVVVAKLNA